MHDSTSGRNAHHRKVPRNPFNMRRGGAATGTKSGTTLSYGGDARYRFTGRSHSTGGARPFCLSRVGFLSILFVGSYLIYTVVTDPIAPVASSKKYPPNSSDGDSLSSSSMTTRNHGVAGHSMLRGSQPNPLGKEETTNILTETSVVDESDLGKQLLSNGKKMSWEAATKYYKNVVEGGNNDAASKNTYYQDDDKTDQVDGKGKVYGYNHGDDDSSNPDASADATYNDDEDDDEDDDNYDQNDDKNNDDGDTNEYDDDADLDGTDNKGQSVENEYYNDDENTGTTGKGKSSDEKPEASNNDSAISVEKEVVEGQNVEPNVSNEETTTDSVKEAEEDDNKDGLDGSAKSESVDKDEAKSDSEVGAEKKDGEDGSTQVESMDVGDKKEEAVSTSDTESEFVGDVANGNETAIEHQQDSSNDETQGIDLETKSDLSQLPITGDDQHGLNNTITEGETDVTATGNETVVQIEEAKDGPKPDNATSLSKAQLKLNGEIEHSSTVVLNKVVPEGIDRVNQSSTNEEQTVDDAETSNENEKTEEISQVENKASTAESSHAPPADDNSEALKASDDGKEKQNEAGESDGSAKVSSKDTTKADNDSDTADESVQEGTDKTSHAMDSPQDRLKITSGLKDVESDKDKSSDNQRTASIPHSVNDENSKQEDTGTNLDANKPLVDPVANAKDEAKTKEEDENPQQTPTTKSSDLPNDKKTTEASQGEKDRGGNDVKGEGSHEPKTDSVKRPDEEKPGSDQPKVYDDQKHNSGEKEGQVASGTNAQNDEMESVQQGLGKVKKDANMDAEQGGDQTVESEEKTDQISASKVREDPAKKRNKKLTDKAKPDEKPKVKSDKVETDKNEMVEKGNDERKPENNPEKKVVGRMHDGSGKVVTKKQEKDNQASTEAEQVSDKVEEVQQLGQQNDPSHRDKKVEEKQAEISKKDSVKVNEANEKIELSVDQKPLEENKREGNTEETLEKAMEVEKDVHPTSKNMKTKKDKEDKPKPDGANKEVSSKVEENEKLDGAGRADPQVAMAEK